MTDEAGDQKRRKGRLGGALQAITVSEAEGLETEEWPYALEDSVWDVSVFVAVYGQGELCAFWTIMLIIGNAFIQTVFSIVVFDFVAIPEYTDEMAAGFRTWRRKVGHNLAHIDRVTETSLAARMCAADDGTSAHTHMDVYTGTHHSKLAPCTPLHLCMDAST